MKYLKLYEQYDNYEIDYAKIFVDRLNQMFPNGLKCYHITHNKNVSSILKDGLLVKHGSRGNQIIHTTLGQYGTGRLVMNPVGYSVLEISISPDEYYGLFPEEETYLYDELIQDCEDGDCEDNMAYKSYLEAHPDIVGGDITFYDDIEPHKITVVEKDGVKV
jgi:hypothetical protein